SGGAVDWAAYLPAAARVELPTYAFQRRRYWLDHAEPAHRGGYPLLDAAVEFAEEDGFLLSGRLATRAQPWLGDHTVLGATVVPGSVFAELALHAAAQAGADAVAELTLQAPLVLPEHGAVEVQMRVGAPDAARHRPLTVHARPAGDGTPWTCYARALLGPVPAGTQPEPVHWPPPDATALDVGSAYADFAATGLEYGPAFQGLRAAWRRGDEIFADIALPELTDTGRYGLHPALLDAALHALRYLHEDVGGRTLLPFAWNGITLRRAGASALRVRISPVAAEAARIELADPTGAPVGVVESLAVRPISAEQLGHHESLYVEDLVPAPLPAGPDPTVLTCADLAELPEGELPGVVVLAAGTETDPVAAAGRALGVVRTWLAEDRFALTRLALRTRNARTDPAAAAVWGLLRSVQQEHPDRFLLADAEGTDGTDGTRIPAAAWNVPGGQLVLRDGAVLVPRLSQVPLSRITGRDGATWDQGGPVLITGGLGTLGAALARHLAADCGVRELVLTGRRGPDTPGAAQLAADLAGLGATVRVVACDVAEREAVAALLAEHPVTAVVHAAGVVDDGLVTGLTEERLRAVLAPKVLGARWLDELTRDRELTDFVLFSSAAGVLGAAGQSAYSAANAALDALARARHAAGLPATSLGWGLWEERSGITGGLAGADAARIARAGLRPLSTPEALELFDLARAVDEPVLAPMRLDRAAVRAGGPVPAVLRGMVREAPARDVTAAPAALSGPDREKALLELVRAEAARVLAHDSPAAVTEHRTFAELGVDSLAAVELRNRLSETTGIRLPAAVVFEYATPVALAAHLHASLSAADGTRDVSPLAGLDQLEEALADAEPGAVDQAKLRMRLTALLAKYGGEEQTGALPEHDLSSASDDELFGLVDDLGAG
ncbi:type I polyketide synthase, partial [Streptomyces sp. NPDC052109]|uniref:type I polyketide synthase n=1 Tax=Streptomyces sp. NPDC052109 TaxID=3155527 RepID=UPI00341C3704